MPPTRITVTIKVEDSTLPAEEITVALPFPGMARHYLRRTKTEIEKTGYLRPIHAIIDNLMLRFTKMNEAQKIEERASYAAVAEGFKVTSASLTRIIDLLDLVFSRIDARLD